MIQKHSTTWNLRKTDNFLQGAGVTVIVNRINMCSCVTALGHSIRNQNQSNYAIEPTHGVTPVLLETYAAGSQPKPHCTNHSHKSLVRVNWMCLFVLMSVSRVISGVVVEFGLCLIRLATRFLDRAYINKILQ